MKIEKKERKSPKKIVFDISEEDHALIKRMSMDAGLPMRTWIINAMAAAIEKQKEEELETNE